MNTEKKKMKMMIAINFYEIKTMDQLTLITLLETQIQQEINRLKNTAILIDECSPSNFSKFDVEKETARLAIYQNLVHHV